MKADPNILDEFPPRAPPDLGPITVADFYAYLPAHQYIFVPTRELWPAAGVNARCPAMVNLVTGEPIKPTTWIDEHNPVEQMTWAPGEPELIKGRFVADGGWIERAAATTFNLYRAPAPPRDGAVISAQPWIDHVRLVYPENVEHIIKWLAHRVQHPEIKVNHALVLGGAQGIGKDTLLEPVKHAVGPWNFADISPLHLLGRFNGFAKSVILRLSEARDLGDIDRFKFYSHIKVYTAAPPDVLHCDEKNIREHAVFNVCGVVITSNHKTDGIYLPSDDRRHYVAWSDMHKEAFSGDYWPTLWRWYDRGGIEAVRGYLVSLDLSEFDAKAPPPQTEAWHAIVDANRAPEDSELADALDNLKRPEAVTLTDIIIFADDTFREWLQDRRNRRQIPHRMEAAGYLPVRNDADKHDGQWKVAGKRQTVYALKALPLRDRIGAAARLARGAGR